MSEVWICTACGKDARKRDDLRDISCWVWAVRVYPTSVVRNAAGKIVKARAYREKP